MCSCSRCCWEPPALLLVLVLVLLLLLLLLVLLLLVLVLVLVLVLLMGCRLHTVHCSAYAGWLR